MMSTTIPDTMRRTLTPTYLPGLCLLLLMTGCYLSTGRSFFMQEDSSTTVDVISEDAAADPDADVDAHEPDIEVEPPDPACLYESLGARQLAEPEHETDAPQIYWNGSEVGVVLFESGGMMPHPYVSLVNVAPDLASQSELRMIGEESHGWGEPAWTGEALGLCWHCDPGFVGRTAFRLHDRNGAQISSRVDLDFEGEACLGLVHGGGGFLAAWRHYVWIDDEYLIDSRIQILDSNGTPLGEPMDLARGPYPGKTPALAYTGSEYLVALAKDDQVDFMWLSMSGEITRTDTISTPGAAHCEIAEHDGNLAVAWLTGERWERGMHLQLFDADVIPLGEEFLVAQEGSGASHADLAAVADGWLLAWYQGPQEDPSALMLHIDPEGMPRQPRLVLHEGRNSGYGGPSLLPMGDTLFVGISYLPDETSGWEQVHLLKYVCTPGSLDVCAPQDAALPVVCDDPVSLGWKWNGSACIELMGCEGDCVGEDCHRLGRTEWDCLSDRQLCT